MVSLNSNFSVMRRVFVGYTPPNNTKSNVLNAKGSSSSVQTKQDIYTSSLIAQNKEHEEFSKNIHKLKTSVNTNIQLAQKSRTNQLRVSHYSKALQEVDQIINMLENKASSLSVSVEIDEAQSLYDQIKDHMKINPYPSVQYSDTVEDVIIDEVDNYVAPDMLLRETDWRFQSGTSREVAIASSSQSDAVFSLVDDHNGVFSIDASTGSITGNGTNAELSAYTIEVAVTSSTSGDTNIETASFQLGNDTPGLVQIKGLESHEGDYNTVTTTLHQTDHTNWADDALVKDIVDSGPVNFDYNDYNVTQNTGMSVMETNWFDSGSTTLVKATSSDPGMQYYIDYDSNPATHDNWLSVDASGNVKLDALDATGDKVALNTFAHYDFAKNDDYITYQADNTGYGHDLSSVGGESIPNNLTEIAGVNSTQFNGYNGMSMGGDLTQLNTTQRSVSGVIKGYTGSGKQMIYSEENSAGTAGISIYVDSWKMYAVYYQRNSSTGALSEYSYSRFDTYNAGNVYAFTANFDMAANAVSLEINGAVYGTTAKKDNWSLAGFTTAKAGIGKIGDGVFLGTDGGGNTIATRSTGKVGYVGLMGEISVHNSSLTSTQKSKVKQGYDQTWNLDGGRVDQINIYGIDSNGTRIDSTITLKGERELTTTTGYDGYTNVDYYVQDEEIDRLRLSRHLYDTSQETNNVDKFGFEISNNVTLLAPAPLPEPSDVYQTSGATQSAIAQTSAPITYSTFSTALSILMG